jgi:hypothetical protein
LTIDLDDAGLRVLKIDRWVGGGSLFFPFEIMWEAERREAEQHWAKGNN